jgi:hypothetical protein
MTFFPWLSDVGWLSDVFGVTTGVATALGAAYAVWRWVIRRRVPLPASVRLLERTLFAGESMPVLRAVTAAVYCRWRRQTPLSTYAAVRIFSGYQLLRPRPRRSFICPSGPDAAKATKQEGKRWDEEFEAFFTTPRVQGDTPRIALSTYFDLYHARDAAERYFKALPRDSKRGFVCQVEITLGFLAPLHLLHGLLEEFKSDWPRVIGAFGDDVKAGDGGGRHPALQTSMFNIWLLWGPSIPLCTCEQFRGVTGVQYGFGDENNSIPLIFDRPKLARDAIEDAGNAAWSPSAIPAAVKATPFYGKALNAGTVAGAQQHLLDYPVVLRDAEVTPLTNLQADGRYYTSYIWVMFVLTDEDGQPLFKDAPWRSLYPLFEHTNIANADVSRRLKQQLAHKAITTILDLSGHGPGQGPWFAYACASDDAACSLKGEHQLVVPASAGASLRELMRKEINTITEARKAEAARTGHSVTRPSIFNLNDEPSQQAKETIVGQFSACHLPDIISRYYSVVDPKPSDPEATEDRGDRKVAVPRAE